MLSGGQAPGGHNVISGLYDMAKKINAESRLYGFLNGPHGIFTGNYVEINDEFMDKYRNMGGFDMIRKSIVPHRCRLWTAQNRDARTVR